jgi:hypothetical protein
VAYLVRIGRIESNVGKTGARGYVVKRSGTTVTVLLGKIEAIGGGTTRFYWRYHPKPHVYRRSSITAARALAKKLVDAQLRPGVKGSYHKLPPGVRILNSSRNPARTEAE